MNCGTNERTRGLSSEVIGFVTRWHPPGFVHRLTHRPLQQRLKKSMSYPVAVDEVATAVSEASVLISAMIRSTPFNCSSWLCTDDLAMIWGVMNADFAAGPEGNEDDEWKPSWALSNSVIRALWIHDKLEGWMAKLRQKGRIHSMMMSHHVDFVLTVWFCSPQK